MVVKAVIIPSREKRPCRRMCKAVFLLRSERFEASLLQIRADDIDSDGFHVFRTKLIPAVPDPVMGFFKNPQHICQPVFHLWLCSGLPAWLNSKCREPDEKMAEMADAVIRRGRFSIA